MLGGLPNVKCASPDSKHCFIAIEAGTARYLPPPESHAMEALLLMPSLKNVGANAPGNASNDAADTMQELAAQLYLSTCTCEAKQLPSASLELVATRPAQDPQRGCLAPQVQVFKQSCATSF